MAFKIPTALTIERLPMVVRILLGCAASVLSVALTYWFTPLRAFPLLLAFPTVVVSGWFFGMAGSFGCAVLDVILIDTLLTKAQLRFSTGSAQEELRLYLFIILSTLLGVLIRRFADQRAEMASAELKRTLEREVTQREIAEERARTSEVLRERDQLLQLAMRANGMGLWVWDFKEGTIYRSDEVYRMVGCEPGAFGPQPEEWLPFVHPDDREGLAEAFAQSRATGKDFHHRYRVCWKDGSLHWLESQGKCQSDGEGRIMRIVGVMADVTHRQRTEEAMLRAEKLAVAGRLAASVAHEINNPLEAVTNLLYLITLSDTVADAHMHARTALDELLRVSMITQSTLKFHRQPGTPKITMLSEVVEGIAVMFRGRLSAAAITFDMRVSDEVAIACMPSEAQQIFSNLMANAIEAMPRGGRMIVRLRPSHDWRNGKIEGMRITFGDTGVGMDRATMSRIFEPFFTTKTETGTGLGMWVVAQLIERHGGQIRVRSSPRYGVSGSVFSIFLPAGRANPEGVDMESGEGRSVSVEPPVLDPITRA